MHDVGRLFIFKNLVEKARNLIMRCKSSAELLFKEEKAVFGLDHADVGQLLLEKWDIPANIQEMVTFHHRPLQAKSYPVEASIMHVADIIVHSMELGNNGEQFVPPLNPKAWSILELQPSVLPSILDQMDRQFSEVLQSLYPEQ